MAAGRDPDAVAFATPAEWEAWLEAHPDAGELWLKFAKKASAHATITHAEALDVALCFGWIDGRTAKLDDDFFLQRFTPRGRRSSWSKINRQRALELEAAGRMRDAGRREVERAKGDGRWDAAYDGSRTSEVPDDLQRELAARPGAAAFFEGLDSRNRYAILYRLQTAKRPETRARRLAQYVEMLEAGETLHPPAKRRSS